MHRYALLSVLLVLVAGFHVVDAAAPQRRSPNPDDDLLTNAQRLARGLTPLPPRGLFAASPVEDVVKRQHKVSALPRAQACIKAKSLYRGYETLTGYLAYAKVKGKDFSKVGRDFVLTTKKERCVRVYVPKDLETRSDSFSLEVVQLPTHYTHHRDENFLAAAYEDPSGKVDVTDDYKQPIKLTLASKSKSFVKGVSAYDDSYYSESKIFEYSTSKKSLHVTVINKEKEEVPLSALVTDPSNLNGKGTSGVVHFAPTSKLDTTVNDQAFELSFEI